MRVYVTGHAKQAALTAHERAGCAAGHAAGMNDGVAKFLLKDLSLVCAQLVAKVYDINPHPHWEIFLTLLCFLFSLHLYW